MVRAALHELRRRGPAWRAAATPRSCASHAGQDAPTAAASEAPFSRELLRCRSTKDYLTYALRRGAVIKRQRGTHATIESNGVCYTLANVRGKDLWDSARKVTVQVFDRMGIARDQRPKRGGEEGFTLYGPAAAAKQPPSGTQQP